MGRKTAQTQFYISKQDQGIYQQEADLQRSQDQTSRVRSSLDSKDLISIYQVVTAIRDKKGNDFNEDNNGSFSCFYRQGSAKVPRGLAGFSKTLADQDEGTPKNVRRSEVGILGDKSQESQNAQIKIPGRPVSSCRRGSDPTLDCSHTTSKEAKLRVHRRAPDGDPCQQDPGRQAEGDPPRGEQEDWFQG